MRGSCRSACFASFAKQMTWAIFQIGWRTAGREAAMVGGGGGLILVLQFVAGAALSEVACPGEAGVRGGWRFATGPLSLSPPAVRRMSFRSARTINSMKSGGFMKRGGHCFASCRPSSCATCTARTRCAISPHTSCGAFVTRPTLGADTGSLPMLRCISHATRGP